MRSKSILLALACTAMLMSALAGTGIVHADDVSLRKEPSTESERLDKLDKGTQVEILGSQNNWYHVSAGGKKGFIRDDFIVVTKTAKEEAPKTTTRYINSDNVNIRSDASTDAEKIGSLDTGAKIDVLASKDDWYKILFGSGTAYVRSDFTSKSKPEKKPEPANEQPANTAAAEATKAAQSERGVNASAVVAPKAFKTAVTEPVLGWDSAGQGVADLQTALQYLGYYNGGVNGVYDQVTGTAVLTYQKSNGLNVDGIATAEIQQRIFDEYDLIRSIIDYAYQLRGIPYRRNGRSIETGFDCSGYTRYVFKQFGVSIGASSSDQNEDGVSVPLSELRPGDLVTFGPRIHHVGIYIGEGNYIHSPQTGDVIKVAKLVNEKDDVIYGRRIIGQRIIQ